MRSRSRSLSASFVSTLVACLVAGAVPASASEPPSIPFPTATFYGISESRDGYDAYAFLGIQYARADRFTNPQLWEPRGTVDARSPGAICPQVNPATNVVVGAVDCLFLNIWVPTTATPENGWPVLFFIHGGAFITGSSTAGQDGILFDGTELSNLGGGAVVVTINYRLGALGFLAAKDASGSLAGNYGFQDQLTALAWVQRYIAGFGGDPSRVTIAGQSAGAISVGYHLFSSSQSAGLFSQAILESNPLGLQIPSAPGGTSAAATATVNQLKSSDCNGGTVNVSCLRSIDYKKLTTAAFDAYEQMVLSYHDGPGPATNLLPWGPILDGSLLTRQPLAGAKSAPAVRILLGTNLEEGQFFREVVDGLKLKTTGEGYIGHTYYSNFVTSLFGNVPTDLPHPYKCTTWDLYCGKQFAQLLTDYVFTCPVRYLAALQKSGPDYAYQFDHAPTQFTFPACIPAVDCPCKTEACHSAELPFVWDGATAVGGSFTSDEKKLSDRMAHFWASFVATGDPNSSNGPWGASWPTYATDGGSYLVLDLGNFATSTSVGTAANCGYWDGKGYEGGIKP